MARSKNEKLKKANTKTDYTPEQIVEFEKCMNDFSYFSENYIKVKHPVKGAVPFKLYDYQKKMVECFEANRYVVTLSSRQTGKCNHFSGFVEIIETKQNSIINRIKKVILFLLDRSSYERYYK